MDNCVQVLLQLIMKFVFHECKSGKSVLICRISKQWNNCYFNQFQICTSIMTTHSLIRMTNHAKCKGFCTNIKVSNPILCDCGRTIYHITKHFEMFTLVTTHRIKIHHEKLSLTFFYNCDKIKIENIIALSKFDKGIYYLQQWEQTKQD